MLACWRARKLFSRGVSRPRSESSAPFPPVSRGRGWLAAAGAWLAAGWLLRGWLAGWLLVRPAAMMAVAGGPAAAAAGELERCDVLIAGAGAAGLAAARTLLDAQPSLKVVVIEARDRLGGRACTTWSGGRTSLVAPERRDRTPWELGAEFIHGSDVVTWRYLRRYGLRANDGSNARQIWVHTDHRSPAEEGAAPVTGAGGGLPSGGGGGGGGGVRQPDSRMLERLERAVWRIEEAAAETAEAAQLLSDMAAPGSDRGDDFPAACVIPSAAVAAVGDGDHAAATAAAAAVERVLRTAAAEYFGTDLSDVSLRSLLDCDDDSGSGGGSGGDDEGEGACPTGNGEPGCGGHGGMSWRLDRGYSALWEALADGLDVRYNLAVRQFSQQQRPSADGEMHGAAGVGSVVAPGPVTVATKHVGTISAS
jgi:hypothetical protein